MMRTASPASRDPFEHAVEPYRSLRVAAEARLVTLRDALASGQPAADARARVLGRRVGLERALARREARAVDAANVLARSSLVLPGVFLFLLIPLTLDGFFELGTGLLHGSYISPSFGHWIATSMVVVGLAHVVGALLVARFASRLARMTMRELAAEKSYGVPALGWTVLAAAMPGIVLYGIPPLLVAVSGIAFMPFHWRGLRRVAAGDRRIVATVPAR
jgi:hypothetical protein